jgi:hypothetical protein
MGLGFTGGVTGNIGHVEASAAALLRRLQLEGVNVSQARLYLNLNPCLREGGCAANLGRMIPPGTALEVWAPGNSFLSGRNVNLYYRRFTGI